MACEKRYWVWGLVCSALLLAGCGDEAAYEMSDAGQLPTARDANEEGFLPERPVLVALSLGRVTNGAADVSLVNRTDRPASVELTAVSAGASRSSTSPPQTIALRAGEARTVTLSRSALALASDYATPVGNATIVASTTLDDGRTDVRSLNGVYYAVASDATTTLSAQGDVLAASQPVVVAADVGIAAVVSKVLCFNIWSTFDDANVGEDIWTTVVAARPATGYHWHLSQPGIPGYIEGDLDVNGCSILRNMETGARTVTLTSFGRTPAGRLIDTRGVDGNSRGAVSLSVNIANSNATQTFTLDPRAGGSHNERILNTHAVFAHAMFRNPGNVTAGTLLAQLTNTAGSHYDVNAQTLFIAWDDYTDKFVIAHESGHMILRRSVTPLPPNPWQWNSADPDCDWVDGHTLFSKEWQGTAFHEGFGSFYAAATFNNVGVNNNCRMRIAGTTLDCETGPTGVATAWMVNNCGDDTFAGKGNETDWMRVFWNVRTGVSAASSTVPLNTMLSWFDLVSTWSATGDDVYQELNGVSSTNANLDANWDSTKVTHRINFNP